MTHEEMIQGAHDALFNALPESIAQSDKELIEEAFLLAKEAHKTQTRDSGIPYILHPLAVALITVQEMRQKNAAIVAAALLHDVVEDTDNTIDDIRARFGEDVAFLVGAVTKPNRRQVDNFQHILGSVKGDIRVLLLKLSDRLHNMRTLSGLKPQRQWKIASETQFFFAPLAGRLGLYMVKSELENLAFKFLNPMEYARTEALLDSIYQILLDDRTIGCGNYKAGYDLIFHTAPGKHTLSAYAPAGVKPRPFNFTVEAESTYRIDMDYKLEKRNGIYHVFATSIQIISSVK